MKPTPFYTVIKTTRGKYPAIVVVNSALRKFNQKEQFPWHLTITIGCNFLGTRGMPTPEEVEVLEAIEDGINSQLETAADNVIFLARVTCQGERNLLYRVSDPEVANKTLQELVSDPSPLREWDYEMESDPSWELAVPELKLLESDPRIN